MLAFSLVLFTLGYSVYMYVVMGEYWYSYLLLLVMLSGVIVVFVYMASLIPNEGFEYMGFVVVVGVVILLVSFIVGGVMMGGSFLSIMMWVGLFSEVNMFIVSFLLFIMVGVVSVVGVKGGNFMMYV